MINLNMFFRTSAFVGLLFLFIQRPAAAFTTRVSFEPTSISGCEFNNIFATDFCPVPTQEILISPPNASDQKPILSVKLAGSSIRDGKKLSQYLKTGSPSNSDVLPEEMNWALISDRSGRLPEKEGAATINVNYQGTGYVPSFASFDYGADYINRTFNAKLYIDQSSPRIINPVRDFSVLSFQDPQAFETRSRVSRPSPNGDGSLEVSGYNYISGAHPVTSGYRRSSEGWHPFGDSIFSAQKVKMTPGSGTTQSQNVTNPYLSFSDVQETSNEYGIGYFSGIQFQGGITNLELGFESAQSIVENSKKKFLAQKKICQDGKALCLGFQPEGNSGAIPVQMLAESMGYSHFNWRQIITAVPSNVDFYDGSGNQVVDDGKIKNGKGYFVDPLPKGNIGCLYREQPSTIKEWVSNGSKGPAPANCEYVAGDTKGFYLDIPEQGGKEKHYERALLQGGTILSMFDRPKGFSYFPSGNSENERFEILTQLVGVKIDPLVTHSQRFFESYEPIEGFSVKWSSNLRSLLGNYFEDNTGVTIGPVLASPLSDFDSPFNNEDFLGGIEILDDQVFFDELSPQLLSALYGGREIQIADRPSVPTPALLPGLISFGLSMLSKKKQIGPAGAFAQKPTVMKD